MLADAERSLLLLRLFFAMLTRSYAFMPLLLPCHIAAAAVLLFTPYIFRQRATLLMLMPARRDIAIDAAILL